MQNTATTEKNLAPIRAPGNFNAAVLGLIWSINKKFINIVGAPPSIKEKIWWGKIDKFPMFNLGQAIGKQLTIEALNHKLVLSYRYDYDPVDNKKVHLNVDIISATPSVKNILANDNTTKFNIKIACDYRQVDILGETGRSLNSEVMKHQIGLLNAAIKPEVIKQCLAEAIFKKPYAEIKAENLLPKQFNVKTIKDRLFEPKVLDRYLNLLVKNGALPKDLLFNLSGLDSTTKISAIVNANLNEGKNNVLYISLDKSGGDSVLHKRIENYFNTYRKFAKENELPCEAIEFYNNFILTPLINQKHTQTSINLPIPGVEHIEASTIGLRDILDTTDHVHRLQS